MPVTCVSLQNSVFRRSWALATRHWHESQALQPDGNSSKATVCKMVATVCKMVQNFGGELAQACGHTMELTPKSTGDKKTGACPDASCSGPPECAGCAQQKNIIAALVPHTARDWDFEVVRNVTDA